MLDEKGASKNQKIHLELTVSVNHDLLTKLLNLTRSDNDNEALLAIRRANELLAKSETCWDKVIGQLTSGSKPSSTSYKANSTYKKAYSKHETDKGVPTVMDMLDVCLDYVTATKGREFIISLYDYYTKHRRLTEKQREALRKFYDNCMK